MKKLGMFIVAIVGTVGIATAVERIDGTITVAAGGTTGSFVQEIFLGDGVPANAVHTVFAAVTSGTGTGVVTFAISDFGKTETIATSGSLHADTAGFFARPVATTSTMYTYPVVQNVVTGDVIVARENLQTNYLVTAKSYVGRQIRVSVAQLAVAAPTVYTYVIYVDPAASSKK